MKNTGKIYTVTEINTLIKAVLDANLPGRVTVTGQITDWKLHHSGHCYFALKDENSKLPAVMWKSRYNSLKFLPENGLAVIATGCIEVYVPNGKYQLIADKLQPAGKGALQLAFEQMYEKLRAEGLFNDEYKKPLPPYPQRIGILTSESGAAVQDITNSIHSRWPAVKLLLYPVAVQGEGAAEQIAAALDDVNRRNRQLCLDILIVGRGGGALEDLWAFNEEVLARAIFRSKIPVVSAVGHEIDTTIADLVADVRASTPTKAGVVTVPDMYEVLDRLAVMQRRLAGWAKTALRLAKQHLETVLASEVFRKPFSLVTTRQQLLDETEMRVSNTIRYQLAELGQKVHLLAEQVRRIEPHRLLRECLVTVYNLQNRARMAAQQVIGGCRVTVSTAAGRLAALNPKSVLQRGYSITTNAATGRIVRLLEDAAVADTIITELADENLIESKVTKKQNKAKRS